MYLMKLKKKFEEYREKFGEILEEHGWSFVENLVKNIEKNLVKFWEQFGEILEENWWHFGEN